MKVSKFTNAQKAFIIQQGEDGTPVEKICRKAGISQAMEEEVRGDDAVART